MKGIFLRLLSIAFVAVFIAAVAALPSLPQYVTQEVQMGGAIGMPGGGPDQVKMLTHMLSLTPNQQEQVKALLEEKEPVSKPLVEQLKQASDALVSAQKAGAPDADIDQLSRNMANISGEILALDAKAQSRIYSLLTPEQKQQLEQLPRPYFVPSAPLLPPGPVLFVTSGGHRPN
jgi:Spy/CpxP family protein refolding chaperone